MLRRCIHGNFLCRGVNIRADRRDIIRLPDYVDLGRNVGAAGYRMNGKVLPIDERWIGHWNHDPWELDEGGDGTTLSDGGAFLLPSIFLPPQARTRVSALHDQKVRRRAIWRIRSVCDAAVPMSVSTI